MATATELETRIAAAETALANIVSGEAQSYTTPTGVSFTALSVGELRTYIADLQRQLASQTTGARRNYTARGRIR